MAYSRLGHKEKLGGLGKIFYLGQDKKGFQVIEIHNGSISMIYIHDNYKYYEFYFQKSILIFKEYN